MSFSQKNIITFGGCHQDFMLVVNQSSGNNTAKEKPTQKYFFTMSTFKVKKNSFLKNSCKVHQNSNSMKKMTFFFSYESILRFMFLCYLSVQIRELTLLMACYINSTHQQKSAAHHLSAPALLLAQCQSAEQHASKSPPAGSGRPSKGPTLL